jgi:hypothetical protein
MEKDRQFCQLLGNESEFASSFFEEVETKFPNSTNFIKKNVLLALDSPTFDDLTDGEKNILLKSLIAPVEFLLRALDTVNPDGMNAEDNDYE